MRDDRDYKIDLSSTQGGGGAAARPGANGATGARPFISVHFACCNVYLRIYRSPDGTAYRGRCPKCGKPVHFAVGHGGTESRTFRVS
jgi:hypothetical protein